MSTHLDLHGPGADGVAIRRIPDGGTTVNADDLQPGDIVDYRGERHRVTHIERRDGWAWSIASDDTGWGIALDHQPLVVHRAAA
jgi:hypothetical protein